MSVKSSGSVFAEAFPLEVIVLAKGPLMIPDMLLCLNVLATLKATTTKKNYLNLKTLEAFFSGRKATSSKNILEKK